ncbi:MAG: hypothetical protein RLZZ196_1706 [Bacteroidota bacterium]|jgi:hypothetical protein
MKYFIIVLIAIFISKNNSYAQISWKEVSADFGITQNGFKVYESEGTLADSAFRAFYVKVDKANKNLLMDADTTLYRRFTPNQFYEKLNHPLLVVNCSFFEFKNNTNVNMIVQKNKLVAHNVQGIPGKGKDTLTYLHVLNSAVGMNAKDKFEIGYTYTDSTLGTPYFQPTPLIPYRDSSIKMNINDARFSNLKPWKVNWAVGGGPVLLTNGEVNITNNQEHKFAGKAILDRHPRTAMGYTKEGALIIMVIQGRMKGVAVGATLNETASLLKEIGCEGAINLDGGGSSCMLVNGKETIKPSDPTGQRPVPAVFYVAVKN